MNAHYSDAQIIANVAKDIRLTLAFLESRCVAQLSELDHAANLTKLLAGARQTFRAYAHDLEQDIAGMAEKDLVR